MSMGWSFIILEGYCARKWDYHNKSSKWTYGWKGNKNPEDRGKKPNPHYDPDVKLPERPEFCEKHVCYTCYDNDCPHLAIGEGRMKDVKKVIKHFKKKKGKK